MNCERAELLMLSEYQHNLRLCQKEGNHGAQYLLTECGALQRINQFQSDELNAQRGMLKLPHRPHGSTCGKVGFTVL
eukprot:3916513-Prorocentrum_lima.AAC.1